MKPPRTHTVYSGNEVVEVRELTYDWDMLRKFRDDLLEQTDWRAVKDRTMSQAWKDYRQALRDLPQDYENANDAADNWPVMPDA
mgnify:CR=1 FL=1|tara:strand:+ start:60 stop:311 length:252 start_codon:yes stop_codon:yes gene_type:complete